MITSITTHDGTVIVTDPKTGISVSAPTYFDALRELQRRSSARPVKSWSPWGAQPIAKRLSA